MMFHGRRSCQIINCRLSLIYIVISIIHNNILVTKTYLAVLSYMHIVIQWWKLVWSATTFPALYGTVHLLVFSLTLYTWLCYRVFLSNRRQLCYILHMLRIESLILHIIDPIILSNGSIHMILPLFYVVHVNL